MSATLYNAALVLHIIGITLMAGASFIDFVTFNAFVKSYGTDIAKSCVLEDYLHKLQRFLGIGMLLILISGITMMIKLHAVWGMQLWFRIKMGLLLLVILNGLGLRRMLGTKLKKLMSLHEADDRTWPALKRKMTVVQLIQLLLFIIIFTLSVFKFS